MSDDFIVTFIAVALFTLIIIILAAITKASFNGG